MEGYINRLIKCGFTPEEATEKCKDIIRNFSVAELDVYVKHIEENTLCG